MLVLTRKERQSLFLILADGTRIEVIVQKTQGSGVKVAIDAPKAVRIVRNEIMETIEVQS